MKWGMEPFLVLNRTISSKSACLVAESIITGFSCHIRKYTYMTSYVIESIIFVIVSI